MLLQDHRTTNKSVCKQPEHSKQVMQVNVLYGEHVCTSLVTHVTSAYQLYLVCPTQKSLLFVSNNSDLIDENICDSKLVSK